MIRVNEDKINQEIIKFIQGDIPLTAHPFEDLAVSLNIPSTEVVTRIKLMQEKGIIRRFGAIIRHQKAGYNTNAMVAWQVEIDDADRVGQLMAASPNISHCYLREVPPEFGYNLFTMIHAQSEQQLEEIIKQAAEQTNIQKYIILKSIKELKKVSMKYY